MARAALSLAKKLRVEILVDEAPARVAAKLLGIKPRGTIFVLLKALEMGKIDLDGFLEILNRMIEHGFRLREEVFVEAVIRAKKIVNQKEYFQ